MAIGLSRSNLDGPRIDLRQSAPQAADGAPQAHYTQYRSDFDSSYDPGPSFNTQHWNPAASIQTPPSGSHQHQSSVGKVAEAAIGAGAQSIMSYVPHLVAPITAAIGAGGLTLWGASGVSRFFGGKKPDA